MQRRYVVISPVRNESAFLEQTIASVIGQTIQPLRWVIVDDGSTDRTREIAEKAAEQHAWIQVITRHNRGFRQSGLGVVEAFYDGFSRIADLEWDFVVKMDGDITFPPEYFQRVMDEFDADPALGICSGDIYNDSPQGLVLDSPHDPAFHVRGAAKVYSKTCWRHMGGIPKVTGFDCVDNLKARLLGWDTRRIPQPAVIHLRPTGAANGTWRNSVKDGIGANSIGYHPLFLVLKALRRLVTSQSPIASLGLLFGFLIGYRSNIPRVEDKALIRFVRKQQIARLLGRETIWR